MYNDFRKKLNHADVHPALFVQYHPAEAVRKRGDGWLNGKECWNVSVHTVIAMREHVGPEFGEFIRMCSMERGEQGRV